MICPHCHKPISRSDAARALRSDKSHRAKVLRPCKFCGRKFGAREMRKHVPECPKKPIRSSQPNR